MIPKNRIIPFFIPNYGCPNFCVYCNQRKISGCHDLIHPEDIRNALISLPENNQIEVAFYGGSFTVLPVATQIKLLDAVQPFIHSGVVSGIRVSTRPDAINTEILGILKHYGVTTIELGAQSMVDVVLEVCKRCHTSLDVRHASYLIKESGFHLILQMMTGLPASSRDLDIYSAREISNLLPDGVRLYPTVVLRETELAEWYSNGRYHEHTVEDAVELCSDLLPIFNEKGIPVIRIGLNPTTDLTNHEVIAGAYHPSLGELVLSREIRKRIESNIVSDYLRYTRMLIYAAPNMLSKVIGQKRSNIIYFKEKYGFDEVKVVPSENISSNEYKLLFE